MAPSSLSFASAAAGNNSDAAGRGDGAHGVPPWSRTNRTNPASYTLRRTSAANTTSHTTSASPQSAQSVNPAPYIPPHLNAQRNGATSDAPTRYSREELLTIFRAAREIGSLDRNLPHLFLGSFNPITATNGDNSGDHGDQTAGPEVCWDYTPTEGPIGLRPWSEIEKEFFSTSVHPTPKTNSLFSKEGSTGPQLGNRKPSFSNASNTRTGLRRRDTSETFPSGVVPPLSPESGIRQESNVGNPPASLMRRRTDFRDDESGQKDVSVKTSEENESQNPFSSLRRGPLSAGLNAPSSPWSAGPQSAGFGTMGTFGSFAVGSPVAAETPEKRPGFGSGRGASRFKDLMSKPSNEDMPSSAKDRAFAGLGRLTEEGGEPSKSRVGDAFRTRPGRSETNPYDDAPSRSGSAALSGTQEDPNQGAEHSRYGAFGASGHTQHAKLLPDDPNSPSNSNPYQSPSGAHVYHGDGMDSGDSNSHPTGLPPFGTVRRNPLAASEERGLPPLLGGQRSTSGMNGFGALGALGGSQTWGPSSLSATTPARERGLGNIGFGDSIFSPMAEPQSSGMSPFAAGPFGAPGFGAAPGRPSRLAGLFPPAMQDQMRGDSRNEGIFAPADNTRHGLSGQRSSEGLDGLRAEEGVRGSGFPNELGSTRHSEHHFNVQPQPPPGMPQMSQYPDPSQPKPPSTGSQASGSMRQTNESSPSNQMPVAQQRQMVMPDRIRWLYRDPQGDDQGPFSGLEMHDWFKAGFFMAELQVKKVEDDEWEPLAQLVRRIGNSREPFLVPQIGILHDAPVAGSGSGPNAWPQPPPTTTTTTAQPPFASSFPSFGTTLTAEQQNALERRKQEEQFLMARQKEYLAQQQAKMRHNGGPNHPPMHSLQHHSSTHSLHSQPSFGSITSPTAFQATPLTSSIQPPQPGSNFAESNMRHPASAGPQGYASGFDARGPRNDNLPNLMDRMSFAQRTGFGFPNAPAFGQVEHDHSQRVSSMMQDRAQLHHEQQQAGQFAFLGQMGTRERFDEFNHLQHGQPGEDSPPVAGERLPQPIGAPFQRESGDAAKPTPIGPPGVISKPSAIEVGPPSLTQQVQRSQQAAAAAAEVPSLQHPPPVSISPLPAPAAQRNRQHVADVLAAESRSDTQTPVETPSASLAPWADRLAEANRGPSLKEIQEAEAKVAAAQEQQLAAQRKAQAEQDRVGQVAAPAPPPGLPTSSTWGTTASPATPTTPGSAAWSKAGPKSTTTTTNGASKKSLAQIQKEEESRKQKVLAAAQAQAAAASPTTIAGKRYAELASKTVPAVPPAPAGQWTTVGASGKAKTPAAVVATPQPQRTVSATAAPAAPKARPSLQTRTTSVAATTDKAKEEVVKWAKAQLSGKINASINLDSFVNDLTQIPADLEVIADAVYAISKTMDGRRFAEEFVRRKKQADRGIVEPAGSGSIPSVGLDQQNSAGGWSEVAKKGPTNPPKEESNAGFKVVPAKKKGRKQ